MSKGLKRRKLDVALAMLSDLGVNEDQVDLAVKEGKMSVYDKAFKTHVNKYNCMCDLLTNIDDEGLDYYYSCYAHVNMPFDIFSNYVNKFEDLEECPMEYWNPLCKHASLESLEKLYCDSVFRDRIGICEWYTIMDIIDGRYDKLTNNVLIQDVKKHVRSETRHWNNDDGYNAHRWFPKETWSTFRSHKNTKNWFTSEEWKEIVRISN